MTWAPDLPYKPESAKIMWEIVPYTMGTVLDLGCGPFKPFKHFIGIDLDPSSKADIIRDITDLSIFATNSIDAVFSSHALEDIEDTYKTLKEWFRVVKPGGYLVLYLPHKDLYPNVGEPGANPAHKHDFAPSDILKFMKGLPYGWELIRNETRNEGDEYSFLMVFRKRQDKNQIVVKPQKPQKTCLVVRYGGIGDMIQTSSVVAALKDEGYHVTLNTTTKGYEYIKYDPNIDDFILQDKDQVPNHLLPEYWDCWAKKFDKFANLSESVEGAWLAIHGRSKYRWPYSLRKKLLDYNYLQFMHELAEVPFKPRPSFYPSPKEKKWAHKRRKAMGGGVIIVWALSGSSVHKVWPYMDTVIARALLKYENVRFVLVGDPLSEILEAGWEKEPRVIRTCGKWSARRSLAFSVEQADIVIGPETGILNAVSHLDDVAKLIFLSHSSHNNLTRDWANTHVFEPSVDCYPCHLLHNMGFDYCKRDEKTGTAICAASISADEVWDVLDEKIRSIDKKWQGQTRQISASQAVIS